MSTSAAQRGHKENPFQKHENIFCYFCNWKGWLYDNSYYCSVVEYYTLETVSNTVSPVKRYDKSEILKKTNAKLNFSNANYAYEILSSSC